MYIFKCFTRLTVWDLRWNRLFGSGDARLHSGSDMGYRKTTLWIGIWRNNLMVNSLGCWGSSMKGLSTRLKGELKVRKVYNGRSVAWLIDWGWFVQLQLRVQINWPSFPGLDAFRNTTGQLKKKIKFWRQVSVEINGVQMWNYQVWLSTSDMHQWFGEIPNDSRIDILRIPAGYKLEMFVYRR